MRPVDLMLDEENELKFKVNVDGSRPGTASSRFVVEGPEMDFVFKGASAGQGEISVVIPSLKNILKAGIKPGFENEDVSAFLTLDSADIEGKLSLKVNTRK